MFTRIHYKAIAEIVNRHANPAMQIIHTAGFVDDLVTFFTRDNPNFKADLFTVACGIKAELDEQGRDDDGNQREYY